MSNNNTLTIGLVLNRVPEYSETFFRSKIEGLQALGFRVVLFVEYAHQTDWNFEGSIEIAKDYSKGRWSSILKTGMAFLKSLFVHPASSWRLYQLDRADGFSIKTCLERLVKNEFLQGRDLDWLHYGFGMLAVGRENVAKAIGAKMAVSFRGSDLYLSPLLRPKEYELLFKKEVNYHVLSHEMLRTLVGYNISTDTITVIHPAIDTEFFRGNAKRALKTPIQISSIARLHWKKGLEYTLEALAILKSKGISFQYHLIGSGEEYERLIFATHQLGLSEMVSFQGTLDKVDIRDILSETDIYLQFSIQEGFCNAVLEAQAMGCLCVVSSAEGLEENVLHKQTGWVVPKRQVENLASQIISVLEMPEGQLDNIRIQAINRVRTDFNIEQQIEAFRLFYQNKNS